MLSFKGKVMPREVSNACWRAGVLSGKEKVRIPKSSRLSLACDQSTLLNSSAVFTTEQFPPDQYAPSDLYSEWFRREPDLPCMAASSRQ